MRRDTGRCDGEKRDGLTKNNGGGGGRDCVMDGGGLGKTTAGWMSGVFFRPGPLIHRPPAPARVPSGPTVLISSSALPWALPAAASTGRLPGAPSLTNSLISPWIPR